MKTIWLLPALLAVAWHPLPAQEILYNEQKGELSFTAPAIRDFPGKNKAFWGIHFWEFGDGHVDIEEFDRRRDVENKIEHRYKDKGSYTVRLHLTPFYSPDRPLTLERTIQVSRDAANWKPPPYNLDGRLVGIETSAARRLIPKHRVRVVVNYEAPADGEGFLLFFYNQTGPQKLRFDPVKIAEETGPRPYKEAVVPVTVPANFFAGELKADARPAAQKLYGPGQYRSIRVFRVPSMRKGEKRRLLLMLETNPALDKHQGKEMNLPLTAMWVPAGAPFREATMVMTYKMTLLPVHDPNRIRVQPTMAYYRKKHPKRLTYEVDFQNNAKGTVRNMDVLIPLEGLQARTLQVTSVTPACPVCPPEPHEDSICYQVKVYDQPAGKDSAVIRFYNVGLMGRPGFLQSKKATRGSVKFTVDTEDRRRPASNTQALIRFEGAGPMETDYARTRYRHRSLYLRPGLLFGLNRESVPDSLDTGNWTRSIGLAAGFLNAPLGAGFSWGLEVGWARHRFYRDTVLPIAPDNTFPFGGELRQSQEFDVSYLEAKATAGFQLMEYARVHGGLGLAIPARAGMTVRGQVYEPDDIGQPDFSFSGESTERYGLFDQKTDAAIFSQPLENKARLGLSTHWGVEGGLVNIAVLGFQYEFRYFPNYFDGECQALSNFQVYLRFKVAAIGGKYR
jgi:hypothetical protein